MFAVRKVVKKIVNKISKIANKKDKEEMKEFYHNNQFHLVCINLKAIKMVACITNQWVICITNQITNQYLIIINNHNSANHKIQCIKVLKSMIHKNDLYFYYNIIF